MNSPYRRDGVSVKGGSGGSERTLQYLSSAGDAQHKRVEKRRPRLQLQGRAKRGAHHAPLSDNWSLCSGLKPARSKRAQAPALPGSLQLAYPFLQVNDHARQHLVIAVDLVSQLDHLRIGI